MTSPWAPGSYDGHFNTIFWYFIDQTINWLILKNNQKINQQWNLSFNASLDIQYPALLIVESIPFVIGFLNIKMWTLWFFCAVACTSLVIAQHRCYLLKPFGKNWNLDVVTPLELDTCSLLLTAGVYIYPQTHWNNLMSQCLWGIHEKRDCCIISYLLGVVNLLSWGEMSAITQRCVGEAQGLRSLWTGILCHTEEGSQ